MLVLAFAAAACGGSSSGDDAPTEDTGTVDSSTPTDTSGGDDATDGGDAKTDVIVDTADAAPCVPPKFGGLTKIDGVDEKSAHLHWDPATPATGITYFAYAAPSGTSIDFSTPAGKTTDKTDLVVSGLTKETTYFFVVRASNGSCTDTNFLVREATTKASCNFAQVQPIFDRNCAVSGCHVLPTPPQGLNLSSGFSFSNIVNVDSVELAGMKRVKPSDSENSYLYRKITGRPATGTNAMPPPGATSLPTAEEKTLIQCWIDNGALP